MKKKLSTLILVVVAMTLPLRAVAAPDGMKTREFNGIEFVWVPGGTFSLGCGSWTTECADDEKPTRSVSLNGFWMGKFEVTNKQYLACVNDGGCRPPEWQAVGSVFNLEDGSNDLYQKHGDLLADDNSPVVGISWSDVQKLLTWLNEKEKGEEKFRLPTEAEWEYACRSAGKPEVYAGGGPVDQAAWYGENSDGDMHQVGTKAGNGLGLFDMSGNVWEWVQDWKSPLSGDGQKNPTYDTSGSVRTFRGGAWDSVAWEIRCTNRETDTPDNRYDNLGVRLVRGID